MIKLAISARACSLDRYFKFSVLKSLKKNVFGSNLWFSHFTFKVGNNLPLDIFDSYLHSGMTSSIKPVL